MLLRPAPCPDGHRTVPRNRSTATRPAPGPSTAGSDAASIIAATSASAAGAQGGVGRYPALEQRQGDRAQIDVVDDGSQPAHRAAAGQHRIAGGRPVHRPVQVQQRQHPRRFAQVMHPRNGLLAAIAALVEVDGSRPGPPIQPTSCGMVRSSVSTPSRGRTAATRWASYAQTPAGRTPACVNRRCRSAAPRAVDQHVQLDLARARLRPSGARSRHRSRAPQSSRRAARPARARRAPLARSAAVPAATAPPDRPAQP